MKKFKSAQIGLIRHQVVSNSRWKDLKKGKKSISYVIYHEPPAKAYL